MGNGIVTGQRQQPKFSIAVQTKEYQKLINDTLRDPERAKRFIATVTSAVAVNPQLQDCNAGSILAAALLGESLNLSPSPQLGQYYMVPFKNQLKGPDGKKLWVLDETGKPMKDENNRWIPMTEMVAVFVLGYKGLIQLALRTGQYRKLNVLEIKEGELKGFDPLNEVIDCVMIDDYAKREAAPTVGYYVMFEYLNGFRKAMYWSKDKMISHADRYSPAFSAANYRKWINGDVPKSEEWKYSSFWYKDFDEMAKKTMLRQILTHWGIMTTEMQEIILRDEKMNTYVGAELVTSSLDMLPEPVSPVDIASLQPEFVGVAQEVNLDDL